MKNCSRRRWLQRSTGAAAALAVPLAMPLLAPRRVAAATAAESMPSAQIAQMAQMAQMAQSAQSAQSALSVPPPVSSLTPEVNARAAGAFSAIDLDWADTSRQRAVPVRLYLPTIVSATPAPVPLVVFSHGLGGSRRGYSWLGQHFAGQGLASLHVQHVGSDRELWFGNVLGLLGRVFNAAKDSEALARVQDLRFALDSLLSGPLQDRIDARRIIAAGHSYGANTTLLACGANVSQQGRALDLQDHRLRAAIVISAPPFYGQATPQRILRSVQVPSLHVTATEDVISIPGYSSGIEDRLAVFEATGSARKWLAVFEGGSHSMFTDRSGTGGVTLNPLVKAATRDLTSAFVRGVFEGDESGLAAWPQRHADILARFVAPA